MTTPRFRKFRNYAITVLVAAGLVLYFRFSLHYGKVMNEREIVMSELFEVIESEVDAIQKASAVRSIGRIGNKEIVGELVQFYWEYPPIRRHIIVAFRDLGFEPEELLVGLKPPSPALKWIKRQTNRLDFRTYLLVATAFSAGFAALAVPTVKLAYDVRGKPKKTSVQISVSTIVFVFTIFTLYRLYWMPIITPPKDLRSEGAEMAMLDLAVSVKDQSVRPLAVKIMESDSRSWEMRRKAARTLGVIGGRLEVGPLVRFAQEARRSDSHSGAVALWALGNAVADSSKRDDAPPYGELIWGQAGEFEELLFFDEADPNAYFERGISKIYGGDYDLAVADFDLALAYAPDLGAAFYWRGFAKFLASRVEAAIEDFDLAEDQGFSDYRLYCQRARAQEFYGENEAAVEDFRRCVASGNRSAYLQLGLALREIGKLEEARLAFEEYLNGGPARSEAQQVKTWIEELLGEAEE